MEGVLADGALDASLHPAPLRFPRRLPRRDHRRHAAALVAALAAALVAALAAALFTTRRHRLIAAAIAPALVGRWLRVSDRVVARRAPRAHQAAQGARQPGGGGPS